MTEQGLSRDLYLGFVRIHILHHAAREAVYGKAFREELARHGYDLSYGTLYPIFHGLERAGYLESLTETADGTRRRLYRATPRGVEALADARDKARELMEELDE